MQHQKHKSSSASSNKNPERLVDGSIMANALTISHRTLHRLRSRGTIPHYRVGRSIRYDLTEVMETLADFHVMSRAQQDRPKATSPR